MTTTQDAQAETRRFDSPFIFWEDISLEDLGYESGSQATIRVSFPKGLKHAWDDTWNVEAASDEERQRLGDEQRYELIPYLVPKVVLMRDGKEQVYDLSTAAVARQLDLEVDGQVLTLAMRELWHRAEDRILVAQAKWRMERWEFLQSAGGR